MADLDAARAPARLAAGPGTLVELVASHAEVLGDSSRRLFGDTMPVFAKVIHTSFVAART